MLGRGRVSTRPVCYACGAPAGRYRCFVGDDYSVVKCGRCGLEYTDPVPDEGTLRKFYIGYQDIRADKQIVRKNALENLRMLEERFGCQPTSKVLDFGAGKGVFVEAAGDNCYGVELLPSRNPRIRQNLDEFGDMTWDFITLWGVLEHLAHPKEVMRDLASRLRRNGIIALTTVDTEGVIPYWYKPPEHLSYWTYAAFDALSRACGLEIVEYQPYHMYQLGHIYLEILLSRTPEEYSRKLSSDLPEIVRVPTNEVRVVLRKTAGAR